MKNRTHPQSFRTVETPAALLLLCLCAFAAMPLHAQRSTAPAPQTTPSPTPEPAPPPAPALTVNATAAAAIANAAVAAESRFPQGTLKFRLPLSNLIGLTEKTIMLRNDRSIYTVFLPVPNRYKVLRCRLFLDYTNSISLLPHRSQLAVAVNERILKQMRLEPSFPTNQVIVDIPPEILNYGFNPLQFIAAHRSTEKCQDPNSPELYTQINPATSYLEAEMLPQPVPARLSAIREIVDEKLWYPYPFHICIPAAGSREDSFLTWGSILSQGVGLALGVQPFRVSHSETLRPGMDNIVAGVKTSLSGFLTTTEIGMINGSFIGVKPMKDDPRHYMLVVSGNTDDEVAQAALALGMVNYPLPDSQYAQVDRLAFPDKPMWVRNAPLELPGSYSLRRLGYRTKTIRGFNTGSFDIPIYMPGNLAPYDASNVELRLNFVYGAASREDSTLNFFVNQTFQQALRLKNLDGATHMNMKFLLPTRAFQPGRNILSVNPIMVPYITGECELDQTENLLFTLYDDSTLVMPRLALGALLPNLSLLSQTGFPYTNSPDGSDASVFVTSREIDTINSAWTLLGKIAQISGTLMHRAEVTFRPTRSSRNLLVVGPVDQIPDEVVSNATISPREIGKYRYMVSTNPEPGSVLPTGLEEFMNRIRGQSNEPKLILDEASVAEMDARASLEENLVMVQFESPFSKGHANTIVTAPDSARLLAGLNVMQERLFWNNLKGDVAVWNTKPDSLALAKVSDEFTYGAANVLQRARSGIGRQPVVFALVVLLALALVGYLARNVLAQRRRQMADTTRDSSKE